GNRPGHSLVTLDIDDALTLASAAEHLPGTGMVEGREGKDRDHRYYLVPLATIPSWALSTAAQAAAALAVKGHVGPFKRAFNHHQTQRRLIDFLGTGSQCVCPCPGNERRWVGGVPGPPAVVSFAELWESVCALASAHAGMPATEALPAHAST